MPVYVVNTRFVFDGKFLIKADTKAEAADAVNKHCGMVIGNVQSTLNDEDVSWDFPVHPAKYVHEIQRQKK